MIATLLAMVLFVVFILAIVAMWYDIRLDSPPQSKRKRLPLTPKRVRGFIFLDPNGGGWFDSSFNAPGKGQKWSDWHIEPRGIPIVQSLDARHAPANWVPWFAEGQVVLVNTEFLWIAHQVRIRPIRKEVFWKMLRWGWGRGRDLHGAQLQEADLHGADLRGVDLSGADLRGADLRQVDLRPLSHEEIDCVN
jgi:hypothetical protein